MVLDASVAHECREDGADGRVPGCGALADRALGERLFGVGEHLDDALLWGVVLRRLVVRGVVAQPQGGPWAAIGELDLDVGEAGGLQSASTRPRNVRARTDNEPDNDHTNTPPTTEIGRLFHLSFRGEGSVHSMRLRRIDRKRNVFGSMSAMVSSQDGAATPS